MPNLALEHGRVPTVSISSLSGSAYGRNYVIQLRAYRHIRLLGYTYASWVHTRISGQSWGGAIFQEYFDQVGDYLAEATFERGWGPMTFT